MLNKFHHSLPEQIDTAFNDLKSASFRGGLIERIWAKDASVWTESGEEEWLGWLDLVEKEQEDIGKYEAFSKEVADAGFESIVLLGMGGSSLCPEVFSLTFGIKNFHILDSTVPAQIINLENRVNVASTLFIVASKSGSTLEPNTFKQYFFERVCDAVGREAAGNHFVAITDPGSKLESVAESDGFRAVFYGDPAVGGRFSALSVFGLIPAAAMGIDVAEFLDSAREMVRDCRQSSIDRNDAGQLGLLLGLCHRQGRDKLTIFTSPEIYDVGAWMEQLIAESTGKDGISIIPVDREPGLEAAAYGNDRLFAFLIVGDDTRFDRFKLDLSNENQPYVAMDIQNEMSLGQEFFRWEFATAVAGTVMGINPFNQPDVESAKLEAKKITEAYEQSGELPADKPFFSDSGFNFFGDRELAGRFGQIGGSSLSDVLITHLSRLRDGDYFALLSYTEMNDENEKLLQVIREAVLRKYNVATCLGFGPRFLHSTGQAYKGGANNGLFLQVTSDDANDLEVPGQQYTFGVIKAAQSRGDFQVLLDRGRRALRIHLGAEVQSGLKTLAEAMEKL